MGEQLSLVAPEATKPEPFRPSSGAFISSDELYRYYLYRAWSPGDRVLFVMCNPSTADTTADDPTIRKCTGFAKRWGFGSLGVVNVLAYRATDPANVARAAGCGIDVVGPENESWLSGEQTRTPAAIVLAWGNALPRVFLPCAERAVELLISKTRLSCLGYTNGGQPRHPLMLAYDTPLQAFGGVKP